MRFIVLIALLLAPSNTGSPEKVIRAWNENIDSAERAYNYSLELEESLRTKPPYRVCDPRRMELYDLIIAERKKQIRNFEIMKANDK